MKEVTKQEVEAAITALRQAKLDKAEVDGRIKGAEDIIEAYGISHIAEFADGRLPMENGVIAIKSGVAKPMRGGKSLPTVVRGELAAALPPQFLKTTCDFGALYSTTDKSVRQMLMAQKIEIVREDKYVVL